MPGRGRAAHPRAPCGRNCAAPRPCRRGRPPSAACRRVRSPVSSCRGCSSAARYTAGFNREPAGPTGVQRAVESGVAHLAPTHQRRHLTRVETGDDRGALQLAALVELVEHCRGAAFYLALQQRVEGCKNAEPEGGEVLIPIFLPQLSTDQVEIGGEGPLDLVLALFRSRGFAFAACACASVITPCWAISPSTTSRRC